MRYGVLKTDSQPVFGKPTVTVSHSKSIANHQETVEDFVLTWRVKGQIHNNLILWRV